MNCKMSSAAGSVANMLSLHVSFLPSASRLLVRALLQRPGVRGDNTMQHANLLERRCKRALHRRQCLALAMFLGAVALNAGDAGWVFHLFLAEEAVKPSGALPNPKPHR